MGTVAGDPATSAARRSARERQRRRQRALALLSLAAALIGSSTAVYLVAKASGTSNHAGAQAPPGQVELDLAGEPSQTISVEQAAEIGAGTGDLPLFPRRTITEGNLRQTFVVDREMLRERLAAVGGRASVVEVPQETVASRLDVPIIQQAYRNNCETAALSMLLSSAGVEQDQRVLQREITKAPPLDPETNAEGQEVWGDPSQGFVGRYDGGGPAGGFGVFEQPVLELASRWADPLSLSGQAPQAIYHRLLAGHAVMTWIGLSDGPYESWQSPEGNKVTVNFGEHTVLLTGLARNRIFVNDPIDGLKKIWSKEEFEAKWALLDQRAISL